MQYGALKQLCAFFFSQILSSSRFKICFWWDGSGEHVRRRGKKGLWCVSKPESQTAFTSLLLHYCLLSPVSVIWTFPLQSQPHENGALCVRLPHLYSPTCSLFPRKKSPCMMFSAARNVERTMMKGLVTPNPRFHATYLRGPPALKLMRM
ncbi:hypothetical protein K469DRAFT_361923 [Zopfia rhizophila CBS 207.26]|uniref:Uncharacterized protein n=1 Tax=Zopfia rhizophila CBS 207.26 TaxID=1314779 RepID=A0A6A6ELR0_9PEZI|nr:hypothetical protein K469DRAFT_361923 [Zopfia rhizophila CBS 207.26]